MNNFKYLELNKFQKAINFANSAHVGQTRKGKPTTPYISHPLTVAIILSNVNASEDQIIAGILHDTVEDSEGKINLETIKTEFGEKIAELVGHVTEIDKSFSWDERKKHALEHIYEMPNDALLVKTADFVHNLNDMCDDLEKDGEPVWDRFSEPKEKQLPLYEKHFEAFNSRWKENPLLPVMNELRQRFAKLV